MNKKGFSLLQSDDKVKVNKDSDVIESIKQITSSLDRLYSSFNELTEMHNLMFGVLVDQITNQLSFDKAKFYTELEDQLEIFAIEKGVLSDEVLGLRNTEVIVGAGDIVRLKIDCQIQSGPSVFDKEAKDPNDKGSIFVLGKNRLPLDIEVALTGKNCGDSISVPIVYDETAMPQLANKTVHYNITVLEIKHKIKETNLNL